MGKSARVLGEEFGLTAREVNFLLKEEGFLDGEPGEYYLTEKGEKYGREQYNRRGTGGYAIYNPSWITRTWDDGILNELDITEDRIKEIRRAMSKAKQKIIAPEENDMAVASDNHFEGAISTDGNNNIVGKVILVASILVTVYEITKEAAPDIMRFWNSKAKPTLEKMKNRITGKAEKN